MQRAGHLLPDGQPSGGAIIQTSRMTAMIARRCLLALTVLIFAAGCATTGQWRSSSRQAPLVGAWSLVSATQMRADGAVAAPSLIVDGSERAAGSLIYTLEGTVSVQIEGAPRPNFARSAGMPRPDAGTGAALLETYYAYFGRYEVDPSNRKVKHFVTTSLYPGESGRTYERRYNVEGDLLTLDTAPALIDGESVFNRLVWRRLRQPAQGEQPKSR